MKAIELEALQERLNALRERSAKLNGEVERLHKVLKDDFDCDTIEEANKKVAKWDEETKTLVTNCEEMERKLVKIVVQMEAANETA